jgi:hypothetical protein
MHRNGDTTRFHAIVSHAALLAIPQVTFSLANLGAGAGQQPISLPPEGEETDHVRLADHGRLGKTAWPQLAVNYRVRTSNR